MPVAILEKAAFVVAAFWLYAQGRLPNMILAAALVDLLYGLSFVVAYLTTRTQAQAVQGGLKQLYCDNR
jgi:hypothetical protein